MFRILMSSTLGQRLGNAQLCGAGIGAMLFVFWLGAGGVATAQEPAAALEAPATNSVEGQALPALSADQVQSGLAQRCELLRQRYERWKDAPPIERPRAYTLPELPPEAEVPPRSDAVNGEITIERLGVAR